MGWKGRVYERDGPPADRRATQKNTANLYAAFLVEARHRGEPPEAEERVRRGLENSLQKVDAPLLLEMVLAARRQLAERAVEACARASEEERRRRRIEDDVLGFCAEYGKAVWEAKRKEAPTQPAAA
jgi:hypothetical protein